MLLVNFGIRHPDAGVELYPDGMTRGPYSLKNGMLGMGPFHLRAKKMPNLINAAKQTITELAKTAYFSSKRASPSYDPGRADLHGASFGAMESAENERSGQLDDSPAS